MLESNGIDGLARLYHPENPENGQEEGLSGTRPRRKLSGDGRVRVCVCVCVCVPQWVRTVASRHTDMLAAIRLATTMRGVCANERTRLL